MHRLSSSFVLGYHGCRKVVAENLFAGNDFQISENAYDWLGHGIYFWEANPKRGLSFVQELQARKGIDGVGDNEPTVVGAVIDLGNCLDLTSSVGIEMIKAAHMSLVAFSRMAKTPLPQNVLGPDLLMRDLDCAVVNHLHKVQESGGIPPFETVKGLFREGDPAYAGSGFYEKTHVQIAVRDKACIKGVFRVPPAHLE